MLECQHPQRKSAILPCVSINLSTTPTDSNYIFIMQEGKGAFNSAASIVTENTTKSSSMIQGSNTHVRFSILTLLLSFPRQTPYE